MARHIKLLGLYASSAMGVFNSGGVAGNKATEGIPNDFASPTISEIKSKLTEPSSSTVTVLLLAVG